MSQRGKSMEKFFEIKSMSPEEQKKLRDEIEKTIEDKKKSGIMTEKEIREIEEMRLRPLPDILDVQSVYESLSFDD